MKDIGGKEMDKPAVKISIIGFIATAALLYFINRTTSASVPWSLIPIILLLWWPIGAMFSTGKYTNELALAGSAVNAGVLIFINLAFSPQYLWFLFVVPLLFIWPIIMYAGDKAKSNMFHLMAAGCFMAYYIGLNLFFETRYPFAVYVVYGLAFWPLGFIFRNRENTKLLSVVGTIVNIGFFVALNMFFVKQDYIWAIYVIGPLLWWPISTFAGKWAKTLSFAIISFLLLSAYYAVINLFIVTGHPFVIYTMFALIWWPLGVAYGKHRNHRLFSIQALFVFSLFFGLVNYVTTPHVLWAIYPIFGLIWWPLSVFFFGKKKVAAKG